MSDTLGNIVNQDTVSPLARLAAAVANWGGVEGGPSLNDLYNWGGVVGLPSLHQLITGTVGQPQAPITVNAGNAPQIPDASGPVQPSPPAVFNRGAPGTQGGFAVGDPNALPTVKPGTPLSANTAGMPGFPGAQSGSATSGPQPDRSYNPRQGPLPAAPATQVASASSVPPQPDPPPPMPKPTPDTRPDLPGQPGAKEPDHTQWGVSHSPLQDLINRAMARLENQQPIDKPTFDELPKPVPQQVQNSWMATVLSSAGLLLAAFGSRRSAAPMTAAIKSFGGYIQGYNEGQQEVWKQKEIEYKQQLDYALQRNQLELDRYKVAVEAAKGDTEKMHEMLYAASLLNEDQRGQALLEQNRLDEFFKWTDAHQKWWDSVQAVRHSNFLSGLHAPEPPEPVMPEDLRGYIYGGGAGGDAVDRAIFGQEGSQPGSVSPKGARGTAQIIQATFDQYKQPGESYDNEQDRTAAAERYLAHLKQLYPNDPARVAVGYFSGEGNIAPPGSATPWKVDKDDGRTRTSDYVRGVLGRLDGKVVPGAGGGVQVAGPGGGTTAQPDESSQIATPGSPVDNLAHSLLRGGEPPQGTEKEELEDASARYSQLAGQVAAIANNPDLKGQAVVDALRKIDPLFATTMAAVARNDEGLPAGSGFGTRLFDLRETERALAEKIKPGWTPAQYASKQDLRKQFNPEGTFGKTLYRASGLANASVNVLENINSMPKNLSVPAAVLAQINATGFTNDPKYRKLALSWLELAQEANAIATGGAPTVTTTQDLMKMFPMSATTDGMRSMLKIILSDAAAKTGDIKRIWAANFQNEGGPTGLDPEADAAIDQILHHMNVDTGEFDTKISPILEPVVPKGAFDPNRAVE